MGDVMAGATHPPVYGRPVDGGSYGVTAPLAASCHEVQSSPEVHAAPCR